MTEKDVIYNKIVYLRVGKLVRKFQGSLQGNVCGTVEHVEFTGPVARRNINKIMTECTACTTLTIHTSVFAGKVCEENGRNGMEVKTVNNL